MQNPSSRRTLRRERADCQPIAPHLVVELPTSLGQACDSLIDTGKSGEGRNGRVGCGISLSVRSKSSPSAWSRTGARPSRTLAGPDYLSLIPAQFLRRTLWRSFVVYCSGLDCDPSLRVWLGVACTCNQCIRQTACLGPSGGLAAPLRTVNRPNRTAAR